MATPFKSKFVSMVTAKRRSSQPKGKHTWPTAAITASTFKQPVASVLHKPAGFERFSTKTEPCQIASGKSLGCKIQLVFRKGSPHLRVCRKVKSPGPLIPVDNAREAARVSNSLCACFKKVNASTESGWRKFEKECLQGRKYHLGGVACSTSSSKRKPAKAKAKSKKSKKRGRR